MAPPPPPAYYPSEDPNVVSARYPARDPLKRRTTDGVYEEDHKGYGDQGNWGSAGYGY